MSAPFTVALESQKNAEKQGYPKAYLARLRPGPRGSIDREFQPKVNGLGGNRRAFAGPAIAGDVFEARRWEWTGERYEGGTFWFGVMADGGAFALSREEAFASVLAVRLDVAPTASGDRALTGPAVEASEHDDDALPARIRPVRMRRPRVTVYPARPALADE